MKETDRRARWRNVCATKAEREAGWFQEIAPRHSTIAATGISSDAAIIDVGGGGFTAS
jgi:hypothetical protein